MSIWPWQHCAVERNVERSCCGLIRHAHGLSSALSRTASWWLEEDLDMRCTLRARLSRKFVRPVVHHISCGVLEGQEISELSNPQCKRHGCTCTGI